MSVIRLTAPVIKKHHTVPLEGSKSYSNRALCIAALSKQPVTISSISPGDDVDIFCTALIALGYEVSQKGDAVRVAGKAKGGKVNIDVGPAGTCMRFLTALSATLPDTTVSISGTARMHQRPIGDLVEALRTVGAEINYNEKDGYPPLTIKGKKLTGGEVSIRGDVSSQFISALLMIAPAMENGLSLSIEGPLLSESYIEMTADFIKRGGVSVTKNSINWKVLPGQSYSAECFNIEGDASGASYLWSLAALGNCSVRVCNIAPDSLQGDAKFPELLSSMGCTVTSGTDNSIDWIEVTGTDKLRAVNADMTLMPDTAQTLAVIAACAGGTSHITGLSSLRIKETDRIQAMVNELEKTGIKVTAGPDSLQIEGGKPLPARIATYEDHRMAMSFAPLVTRLPWLEIADPGVVSKSFPGFWRVLQSMEIEVCTLS